MGNLAQRLAALRERQVETVEVEGIGKVAMRAPSWGETIRLEGGPPEGASADAYNTFRGTAATLRDPDTGEPLFSLDHAGFKAFSELPTSIARALIVAASEFLGRQESAFVQVDSTTKKKRSPRARK